MTQPNLDFAIRLRPEWRVERHPADDVVEPRHAVALHRYHEIVVDVARYIETDLLVDLDYSTITSTIRRLINFSDSALLEALGLLLTAGECPTLRTKTFHHDNLKRYFCSTRNVCQMCQTISSE